MLLPELDGSLTGILVSPDLVMRHYHAILESRERPGSFAPLREVNQRNGDALGNVDRGARYGP